MKKLQNPTTFFFKQAENPPDLYRKEIDEFVSKLLDKDRCPLCKKDYSSHDKIPRIMIHCGHTFCTPCLKKFYMNRRVRCPMCLKLVKKIDNIDRIPINHTIFSHIVKKQTQQLKSKGKEHPIKDASVFIFGQFERVQKQAHLQQNPQKIDEDSGLPFCVFHNDRVEHFYCQSHKVSGCRICVEVGHSKAQCKVLDLYNVPDPHKYIKHLQNDDEDEDEDEDEDDNDEQDILNDSDEDEQGGKSV